ncbi:hypothetical protein VTN77DRAFT_6474 [Rasamsonia byssochlamydoides]|uniref:uncharacterized protein n=1 Tax=Rasamsonia byssochlamydoides TaxID=89139 RepID=UPI0037446945
MNAAALRQTALNGGKVIRQALPLQAAVQVSQSATDTILPPSQRTFQTSSTVLDTEQHEKDVEGLIDRNTLNPARSEYSKSGTDDEVASHDVSFDPDTTSPKGQVDAAGRESQRRGHTSNPLDISPGNQEVSKTRDPTEGAPEHGVEKGPSARGWTRKRKPVITGPGQQS